MLIHFKQYLRLLR